MRHPFCFWWIVCAAGAVYAAAPSGVTSGPGLATARTALARLPLRFESNQGQWQPGVRFRARTGGYTLSLTDKGAVLGAAGGRDVEISMLGANPAPAIEPAEPQPVRTNYFVGPRERWHTGVVNYSRVRYRAVYPGIDMVYYGSSQQLEYDFVLAPGADPRAIRIEFRGADRVSVTRAGDLEVESAGSRVLQKKPVIEQHGRAIASRYTLLAPNVVGVRLGAYDRSQTLVIDPVLAYATYMGGFNDDEVTAARLDSAGRFYITGSTSNSTANMLASPGAYDQSNAGSLDVFLAIIDTTGGLSGTQYGLLYLSYLGGSGNDIPTAMQLDSQGNVYLTGTTLSSNFPQVGNTVATAEANITQGWVAQLNPAITGASALLYATYLGGTDGSTNPYAIGVDAGGNIYVLGSCQADDFPVTSSAYQLVRWGSSDMFLAELNPGSPLLLYATYLGGELDDTGRAMVVTPAGLVYFTGSTDSTFFPMAGTAFQSHLTGNGELPNDDLIVGLIDPKQFGQRSLLYCTYLGGSGNDEPRAMAMDAKGNLIVTGYTLSADFPVTSDAAQPTYGGNADAFVMMANPGTPGFLVYSTYLGGGDAEVGYGVAASDSSGFVYVTGYTMSSDFPVQNAVVSVWGGLVDVFVTKLEPGAAGSAGLAFSTYIGAQSINQGSAVEVASDGTVFVAGFTSGDFPVTSNAWQKVYGGGGSDAFVLALTQSTAETLVTHATKRALSPSGAVPLRRH